jgi:hypothetical protein
MASTPAEILVSNSDALIRKCISYIVNLPITDGGNGFDMMRMEIVDVFRWLRGVVIPARINVGCCCHQRY